MVDEIAFLAGDNLNRSQRESSGDLSSYSFHMADQGTDNFDREFALNLVSSEQDVLYEIDDALRRIDMGTYGVCEGCGKADRESAAEGAAVRQDVHPLQDRRRKRASRGSVRSAPRSRQSCRKAVRRCALRRILPGA